MRVSADERWFAVCVERMAAERIEALRAHGDTRSFILSVNRFITYATVNSGREGRICERPKMIDKEPITGRGP